ncbi:UNVERIFIED_CONTAM: hypothetical protein FKN15_050304 [Acipenser sinensis]
MVNGGALPADAKLGKTKPSLSLHVRKLSDNTTVRILVFQNGAGQDWREVIAAEDQTEKFLFFLLFQTSFVSAVPLLDSCLQNSITPLRGPAWVSKEEENCTSKGAFHQKLKPANEYSKQLDYALDNNTEKVTKKEILSMTMEELYNNKEELDYALDNNTEKVTKKEILSMTMEELYNNKEEVNQLIDELRAAIKKHKGQLSKLALQLQAEEEQCAGYVYQHIKQLSTSSRDPQGLQLKAYSEFVLTYLEELNVREEVTQTEKHNHHGAWSSEHQETGDSGYNVSDTNQKQVPRPIDAQSMPPGALRESIQLTVALVRKLEDKHPKASAQRFSALPYVKALYELFCPLRVKPDSLELSANEKAASRSGYWIDRDSLDETLLTLILRNPIDVCVSSGEPFLPLNEKA